MSTQYMCMDTLRFLLYDVHQLSDLIAVERFQEFDQVALDIFLDAVKDFSDQECFPYFREMDEKPVAFADGRIIVHLQIGTLMEKAAELGLIGPCFDYEDGGIQLPFMAYQAAYFILDAANNHVSGYPGMTSGAADLIATFGNDTIKATYLDPMLAGKWAGTMCLTEPQAGSSLSDITTTAYPTEEGHYIIKGQKIWISGGDQQVSENIIHLLLARIDGAPAGTRGISLFVVPRLRPTKDGSLEYNDVLTAGDFQKLGQRGFSTAHLVFGEQENCRGWLIGEANKGLQCMFQLMNSARISVGRHGASISTAAYYASLQYARERPQGRRLSADGTKNLDKDQTLIINHPDVRRMLLFQKAIAEGSLSLILQAARYYDLGKVAETEADRTKYHLLTEILTPMVKTFPSEMGRESVSTGLQVLGGMGYSREHILQQYYRDIRIMAIYEGTTGIQSLDLLGRKVSMHNGQAMQLLLTEIGQVIEAASAYDDLAPYAHQLQDTLNLNKDVLQTLAPFAKQGNYERFLADATIYMDLLGTVVVGWQWLKIALRAKEALLNGHSDRTAAFYESKIHTMKGYFKYVLPRVSGLAITLKSQDDLTLVSAKEWTF
ncbi:MAG: acyl-CoA dehydrogenase [Lewinella sp.]|nr:acyl-CoA dehydrogenase [Lewinella sp.]